MNPSFWKWAVTLVLVASNWGSLGPVRAADRDRIDLGEIARRLTEWRASFVNLRVVWELRILQKIPEPVADWPAPPEPGAGRLFARDEWIWADHGLDLLDVHFFPK